MELSLAQQICGVLAAFSALAVVVLLGYAGTRSNTFDGSVTSLLCLEWGPGAVVMLCLNAMPLAIATLGEVGGKLRAVMMVSSLLLAPVTVALWVKSTRELIRRLRARRATGG